MVYQSHSEKETEELAYNIAKSLHGGEVFALCGDLGSGKTTFAKGFARGLEIEKTITSPTFVIMKKYSGRDGLTLVHTDCYRLTSAEDAEAIGLTEYFSDSQAVSLLEWPENIKEALPENAQFIYLKYLSESEREIEIGGK